MRLACAALMAALFLVLPAPAQERNEPEPLPTTTFMATLVVDGDNEPLPAASTTAGPLFALAPVAAALGGELQIVPIGQSHRLRIAGVDVVLGPATNAMTVGREIVTLRQPPLASSSGLLVPLEALQHSFGTLLGVGIQWFRDERVLEIAGSASRDVALDIQMVHIQGVTTVVLQFDRVASYQVATPPGAVEISIPAALIRLVHEPRPPRLSLVERIETADHHVRLHLADGAAAAEPYVLAAAPGEAAGPGLRLVLDVSRSAAPLGADVVPQPDPSYDPPGLRTIVLDAGHGGAEQGAIGPAGTEEKELTLILAKALKRKLEERLAVQVVLTRNEDADLPLDTRTALANQTKGDLFISIHLNASPASSAHGAETYFLAPQASDAVAQASAEAENRSADAATDAVATGDEGLQLLLWDLAQSQHLAGSQRLARLIQEELNRTLGLADRGVRQAPFAVLMGATMPAVLVELGFISNPKEEERLLDPAYRAELLDAVVRAVVRFKSMLDAGTTSAAVGRE